ncbi:MAG: DUF2867 domain-containing protein [Mesorhizobium sp.]
MKIVEVIPNEHAAILPGYDFADAWQASPVGMDIDLRTLASRLGNVTPRWVRSLMKLRNFLVKPFGLVTQDKNVPMREGRVIFPVISSDDDHVVLGLNDRHLDFRLVLERGKGADGEAAIATTLVRTHNIGGRIYLTLVKPFHRIIVPAMLKQALANR